MLFTPTPLGCSTLFRCWLFLLPPEPVPKPRVRDGTRNSCSLFLSLCPTSICPYRALPGWLLSPGVARSWCCKPYGLVRKAVDRCYDIAVSNPFVLSTYPCSLFLSAPDPSGCPTPSTFHPVHPPGVKNPVSDLFPSPRSPLLSLLII
jgi:hypothetical protein